MSDLNNYGIKVSRQGFDAKTCADHQLLFSSSFKSPLVVYSGTFDLTTFGTQTLFTHNLGYYPAFYLYSRDASTSVTHLDNSTLAVTGKVFVDSTKIWYNQNEFTSNQKISWFLFAIDLETSYSASNVVTSAATQGVISRDYGFKASKAGSDVKTAGLTNLTAFSGTSTGGVPVRSQILHKVDSGTIGNGVTVTVAHGLGYKPMFITYIKQGSNGYFIDAVTYEVVDGPTLAQRWRSWADATNIYFKNDTSSTLTYAYVIMKDPLL
jgi:hypothetical protein